MGKASQLPRERLLEAAKELFANNGYAATSTQQIIKAAKVTKPTLYYYYRSKEGLYQTLVDHIQDRRFDLIKNTIAAHKNRPIKKQLIALLKAILQFAHEHRNLTRLSFSTAFAARGEVPNQHRCLKKGQRNFEAVRLLLEDWLVSGKLNSYFNSKELAIALYGQILIYSMAEALQHRKPVMHPKAERIAELFLEGACSKKR